MLKLVNIKKDYVTKGVPTVHALKGLTVNFRRNEFVAILGASGCGKTTLLNIIGGLDRYTSGDLIIEGKSTKQYNDRDWDTYRNHSIGFVFQSYNLIHHQTILNNVELALTISGISKEERKERALKALATVGLEGMEKKKPNQLSGGQMQRVAIARALVNDPEILLADEPTGALDSETSIQIMDLLKEVASDRLVIMVTHNPDLATAYANRIVTMKDGLITGDNNPYKGEAKEELAKAKEKKNVNKGNKKKSSMSFFTATGLSFSNLLSKLKRTILITIAGSIGIIGISSVLAVSFGVNNYIDGMQDDMLSQYPITVSESAVDYTSLMTGLSTWDKAKAAKYLGTDLVGVDSMIAYLMDKYNDITSAMKKTNEINSDLVDYIRGMDEANYASIDLNYGLDVTNNLFTTWNRGYEGDAGHDKTISLNGLTQMYISELNTVPNFSEYAMYVNLFTNFVNQLPAKQDYILSQYDFIDKESRFPENANEMLIVVDEDQTLTDILFAQLGYFTEQQFLDLAKKIIELQNYKNQFNEGIIDKATYEEEIAQVNAKYEGKSPSAFAIEDILNKNLYYKPTNKLWSKVESDVPTVKFNFNFPGVGDVTINLKYDDGADVLTGKAYLAGMGNDIVFSRVDASEDDPSSPVIGKWKTNMMGSPFEIIIKTDNFVYTKVGEDLVPFAPWKESGGSFSYSAALENLDNTEEMHIVGILKKKKNVRFGCLDRGIYYVDDFAKKFMADSVGANIIEDSDIGLKSYIHSVLETEETYKAYVTYTFTSFKNDQDNPDLDITGEAMALNQDFSKSLGSLFSISGTTNSEIDKVYLRSISGLATKIEEDDDGNITSKTFEQLPEVISIYPRSFKTKDKITKHLDRWNTDEDFEITKEDGTVVTSYGKQRKEITYTDTVSLIISLINTLINAVTIALVSFTSLSLVVSCFMIAVITYISTMERVKEIGVIRSLGGRKKDVSRLFIAETLIIGLASGVFGILITYLLELILNLSVAHLGIFGIAALPIWVAGLMIVLSIVLNVVSGLIPSLKASNQDPVVALRTE